MSDDQDSVGFDLAAWEAPPAPDVADAVLAKMRQPVGAAAIESAEPSHKRWWIAGGAAAAAAAAVLVVYTVGGTSDLTGSGAVATAKPSRIDLGATSAADLDGNTDVRWVRDNHRVVAMQPRGTATWRVASDDKLVLDAGATVASVVASGASLRVEVQMHVTEARMLAGSAVVSAAVALVTVVVYEGQVEVTGAGKTMTVAPGATVEIRPHAPPQEPPVADLVARLNEQDVERRRLIEQIENLKKGDDELRKLREQLAAKDLEIQQLTDKVASLPGARPAPRRLDAGAVHAELEKKMTANRAALVTCGGDYSGELKIMLTVEPTGKVSSVKFNPPNARPATCIAKLLRGFEFGPNVGGMHGYTLVLEPDTRPTTVKNDPTCNDKQRIEDIEAKADAHLTSGSFAQALVHFESILKCNPRLRVKTYMAACKARNVAKATQHYESLSSKGNLAQICLNQGIDPR